MDEFEIIYYEKEDGTKPAMEFLDSLDVKMRKNGAYNRNAQMQRL